ncbi:uncharacterized protein LOC120263469 isoform X2 [Dioscorea cayenensis subsp. rotundata]|uniref:Uncharacterized protein LOC120263469 isoform X2 n=1 Tax=Dioscorea cayennensis subsp. rotundata TaxID=55577 RepID=A0AB40BK24_DIOCR|nr:uncharacterized protein LOC120263469 isoform X2 [Dioscorea cayenensis subsp. rotundata]
MAALPRSPRYATPPPPRPLPFRLVVSSKSPHKLPFFSRSSPAPRPSSTSCSSSSSSSSSIEPGSPLYGAHKRWRRLPSQFRGSDEAMAPMEEEMGEKPSRRLSLWKRRFFLPSPKIWSIILLNVITLIYASNIPVIKEAEMIYDPSLFTMVRFTIAGMPFIPFVLKAQKDWQTCIAGMELGLWLSLGYLAQAFGLLTSDAGRASFIAAFPVILVPLLNGMFGRTVHAFTWFGAIVSLIGIGMLECTGSPPNVGDALNLLSAMSFAIHMLRTEQISRSTKKEKFLPLLGYEVCVVAFSSTIWFFFKGVFANLNQLRSWTRMLSWDWMTSFPWLSALYTGIFSTGFCLWAEFAAMKDVSATETAIIYGLEPVWGAAFAWFLLGERWGPLGWIGAALVICGNLIVQILGSQPKRSRNGDCSSDDQNDFILSTTQ